MPAIILYFQIHQPYRLRHYTVFDLGENHLYENVDANRDILCRIGENSYLPMNALLLDLIHKHKGAFKVSFSISGTALDQFEECAPQILDSFMRLAQTGSVEFLGEPYTHSLACLYSREEFHRQIAQHRTRVQELFGTQPLTFRNTELIYNNDLASIIEDKGYEVILSEGADHILGWRSPNFVYQPAHCQKLRLLLRNYRLSDDIAFRFSDRSWSGFPLTAEKFASWVHAANAPGDVINLFMDYETFGEHHHKDTGIFDFMRALPGVLLAHPEFRFLTPLEAARTYPVAARIDVPQYISWADAERDLTAWLGNDMQLDAMEALYRLEGKILTTGNPDLLGVWRRLQTSDHFYYMSTK
ncbi:MAG: glycoside hydrolase family 57 protein, partial [Deltaproteobacteria bacterium]|nr:glycoside hydrolase family 57 protein [Deltaproteobacteria bacterium]